MPETKLILGQTLGFTANPFETPVAEAARYRRRGALLVANGRIMAEGEADTLVSTHPDVTRIDYGDALITAGFIDAHVHYPQTA